MASVPVPELAIAKKLVLLLAAVSCLAGQRVQKVEVRGAPAGFEPNLAFGAGDAVSSQRLTDECQAIVARLVNRGFLAADVRAETLATDSGLIVVVEVDSGPRTKVGDWSVVGTGDLDPARLGAVLPRRGEVFSGATAERATRAVLHACERGGHPFAQVEVVSVAAGDGQARPVLRVAEGPLVKVDFVEFAGCPQVPEQVLARSARFRPGTVYTPGLVQSWRRNLEHSGFVRVDSQRLVSRSGFGVRFFAAAQRSNRGQAAVGYSAAAAEWTGLLRADLRNVLGAGRRLAAGWRAFAGKTEYDLSYTEPWLLARPVDLTGSVFHQVTDTTRSETRFGIEAALQTNPLIEVALGSGMELVASTDTAEASRTAWVETGFEFDTREPGLAARKGILLGLVTRAGSRSAQSVSALVGQFESDVLAHGPAVGPVVWTNGLHLRLSQATVPVPEFEWYRLGGAASLRGFREDEFSGVHVGWLNSELRYPLGSSVVVYPLVDLGTAGRPDRWLFRFGYGAGVQARTGIGTIGIDYGIADDRNPLQGKVHLKFESEF